MTLPFGLANRAVGQYPISIATSLAFEGLADILEDGKRFKTPPIHNYDSIWINVRTLIRNIIGSTEKEIAAQLMPEMLADAIVSEMSVIDGILDQLTQKRCRVVFYVCNYKNINRLYPKALVKDIKTEKQKFQAALENSAITLVGNMANILDNPIQLYDTTLRPNVKERSAIITHYPFDLLSYEHFGLLELVESHTGAIKKRHQWNTKLKDGKSLERIPFDRMTVQLFGDSGGLLSPYPPDYRRVLLEVADKYRWNTLTTKDRIKMTVKLHNDAPLLILITELYL